MAEAFLTAMGGASGEYGLYLLAPPQRASHHGPGRVGGRHLPLASVGAGDADQPSPREGALSSAASWAGATAQSLADSAVGSSGAGSARRQASWREQEPVGLPAARLGISWGHGQ